MKKLLLAVLLPVSTVYGLEYSAYDFNEKIKVWGELSDGLWSVCSTKSLVPKPKSSHGPTSTGAVAPSFMHSHIFSS